MSCLAVETRGLAKRFGEVQAVAGIDLRVPSGAVYGFLGPNGAGKTTTIRMLLSLVRPDAGEVRLMGEPLRRSGSILARVGSLVEGPVVYPNLTGRENLEVTRRLLGAPPFSPAQVLATVELEDAADRCASTYSLGMKQRLGLARALLGQPALLLLDEPTNGLDPAGIREMRELIVSLPEKLGVTVFLSSHLLAEVEQVATHIGILSEGKLCYQGEAQGLWGRLQQQLVLECRDPSRAFEILAADGWSPERDGDGRLRVPVSGPADAALINTHLTKAGVALDHLAIERPHLEDLFLDLTQNGTGRAAQSNQGGYHGNLQ